MGEYGKKNFVLSVDRDDILGSVLNAVRNALLKGHITKPLKVQFGQGEEGLDQGGVQIELFGIVGGLICEPLYGLFDIDSQSQLAWFRPGYSDGIERYEVIGATVALAVYSGCSISVAFPKILYKMLLGQVPDLLDDFAEMYPSLAEGMRQVLDYPGDVTELGLTFNYTYESLVSGPVTVKLREDEPDLEVNSINRVQFVSEYLRAMIDVIRPQFDAFQRGWRRLIPDYLTELFIATDLRTLVEGKLLQDIDVDVLQRVAKYDGFDAHSPIICNFWDIVRKFTPDQKHKLLEFVTSSERVPVVGGLENVSFIIQQNGPDSDRLPTSLTCHNRLLLPCYKTKSKMEKMLKIAIEHSKGFGLI
ncbi:uncharacterized protein V1516DRAFT_622198 [Lipomyces oligophaga]|uniref:uncharacterized protein n=1 Tax=Lipomyces oligophaga TaxID=45792 RepID=UPI0034CD31A8